MPLMSCDGITNSSLSRILMLTEYYSISKRYKCAVIRVEITYMLKFKPGTAEKNSSSTIGPQAGIEPLPCRSYALLHYAPGGR